ncbi:PH domain-containing protein [Actinoallomurus soli]|uniref:PH domain-containing protein n=1 Tax=Actinoallomurus soli TaxID=2952535 RepID=UPI0020927878|nr:PH domain-containing protein [Actinoallomurus soli]MCO5968227.1 PH domain-containing protein [Actinoallomurus soli]
MAVEGAFAFYRLGVVGSCWLLGGTAALVGLGVSMARRSGTTVGAAGITISWGLGRGRLYSWQEIRWIDVRETKSQQGTALSARITLADGRRRSLPALQHSTQYPDPDFQVDFQRVVTWWESSTEPAARFRPPERMRYKLTPQAVGLILGLLITIIVVLGVVMVD